MCISEPTIHPPNIDYERFVSRVIMPLVPTNFSDMGDLRLEILEFFLQLLNLFAKLY
jgi:hypothetical protein